MGNFFIDLGYSDSAHTDPIGFKGGIWVFWITSRAKLTTIEVCPQAIHTQVKLQNFDTWILSCVYASPMYSRRATLWEQMENMSINMDRSSLVIGDFNEFSLVAKKHSFSITSREDRRRASKFKEFLNNCRLMDIGCSGPRLTWSNNKLGFANTMVRLDRAVCKAEWQLKFPEGTIRNLPIVYSDHSPMILYTQGRVKLNMDGTTKGFPSHGGFGGLLRNEHGDWICGFYGRMARCGSEEAEIWAIYKGLTIMLQKGYYNFAVETDNERVCDLVKNGASSDHPQRNIIQDSNTILERCEAGIYAILREGNKCADILARMGVDQEEELMMKDEAPASVDVQLIEDVLGATYSFLLFPMYLKKKKPWTREHVRVCTTSTQVS